MVENLKLSTITITNYKFQITKKVLYCYIAIFLLGNEKSFSNHLASSKKYSYWLGCFLSKTFFTRSQFLGEVG